MPHVSILFQNDCSKSKQSIYFYATGYGLSITENVSPVVNVREDAVATVGAVVAVLFVTLPPAAIAVPDHNPDFVHVKPEINPIMTAADQMENKVKMPATG